MIDPDDPKRAKDYYLSGILLAFSIIAILVFLAAIAIYAYFNKI